jgi:putative ABC transport system permease protein
MKVGMGYETGDMLHLIYKGSTYQFEIFGFSEDVMFSTPSNVPMEKCFVSKACIEKYADLWGGKATIFRAILKDGYDKEKFEVDALQMLIDKVKDFQYMNNFSVNYSAMRMGATIMANILMGVLTVFAVLLILIALIIIFFNVNNSIESNMKNIGMLEASGYTSRQLGTATIYEFLMISIAGIIAGFLGATGVTKALGGLLSASIGLSWEMGFDIRSAIFSTIVIIMLIFVAAIASSRKYKKIAPLDALRNGINTHNFNKNLIKLEEVSLPLNLSIGLKNILYNKKKNITICLIVVLLSFCVNVTVCVYTNFVLQHDTMIRLIGLETHEVTVEATENTTEGLTKFLTQSKQKLSSMKGIRQILEYTNSDIKLRNGENEVSANCDIYDDTSSLTTDNLVEGKRPEYDNEITLTKVILERLDASLGDVIYLELNGKSKDYLVVGISQGINNLGRKAMITKDGMKRLNKDFVPMALYIYLEEGSDVKGAIKEIESI